MRIRIIAKRTQSGDWSAWFDGRPQVVFRGSTARQAASRLVDQVLGRDAVELQPLVRSKANGTVIFAGEARRVPCPDCDGSGSYVGLTVVEPCDVCGGTGRVTG